VGVEELGGADCSKPAGAVGLASGSRGALGRPEGPAGRCARRLESEGMMESRHGSSSAVSGAVGRGPRAESRGARGRRKGRGAQRQLPAPSSFTFAGGA